MAHTPSRLRALTSLEPEECAALVPVFEMCFLERRRTYTRDGLPRLNRRYRPYKNSPRPTPADKRLCILVHITQNLTQEVQGPLFGMIESDANTGRQVLRAVLLRAFAHLDVVPARLAACLTVHQTPPADQPPCWIMLGPNAPSNDR